MDNNDSKEGNRTCETDDDSDSRTGSKNSETSMNNNDLKGSTQTGKTGDDNDSETENKYSESIMDNNASKEGIQTGKTVDDKDSKAGSKNSESSMDNNDLNQGTQTGKTVDDNDSQKGSKNNAFSMDNNDLKEDTRNSETAVDSDSQIESKTIENIIDNNDLKEGTRTGGTADDTDSNQLSTMNRSDMNNKDSKEGAQTEEIIDDADSQRENAICKSCLNSKELMEEVRTDETADDINSHPGSTITLSSMKDNDSAEGMRIVETDSHSECTKNSSINKKDSKKCTQTEEAACDTDSQAVNTMSESSMAIKNLIDNLVQESASRSENGQNQKHEEQNQNEQDTISNLHSNDMARSGGTNGSPEDESISVLTQEHGRQQLDQNHASDDLQAQQACDENSYGKHRSVKDSEVQFGKNITDERSDTKTPTFYPQKGLVNWHINELSLFIAIIAIILALYTHVCPIQDPKEYVEHNQEPDEFREKLSQCLSRVAFSAQDIKHIQFRLESIEKKVENFVVNKSSNADLVKKEDLGNLFRDIKIHLLGLEDVKKEETKKIFQDEFQKLKTEVDVKVDDLKEKQEKESQCLEKKNAEMVSEMSKLQSTVQNLKVDFVRLSESHDKNNNEVAMNLSQHKDILTGMKQSEETLGNWVKHIANETTVLNNSTDYIMENIFHKGSMIVVIMINTSLVVMVIIYLYSTRGTHRYINQNVDIEQVHAGVNRNPSPYSTAGRILSKVRTTPRLERKLCIISFYEGSHPLHMRMTQSVTQQLDQQLVEFIIRRHEDILEIPKVFLYFLFIDFNERNVIIEDPTLGLGDLRLTTVQAIQKMSGRIVILYVKDPNSKQLDSRKLYNKNLASVTTQRELSALNRISRFISSYESLTDFQKAHLRLIVENELEGH